MLHFRLRHNWRLLMCLRLPKRRSRHQRQQSGPFDAYNRFNRLIWAPDLKSMGIIVGGLENGDLTFWNASNLIGGRESQVHHQHAHKGPIRGLDFNPIQPNLIASGASEGEIFIWDLNNLTKPYTPGNKSQRMEDVTNLSWNRNASHILATASTNGQTVIWDLKNRRDISHLSYPGGRKPITSIAWHPQEALQIATVADDDYNPAILVWDLRNATAPFKQFTGHSKGILSISWCSKDTDLLLSGGKDNKVLVWNTSSGTVIGDLHNAGNWVFDVQWSQKNPDLSVVASFDGKVTVHSILGRSADIEEDIPSSPIALPEDPFAAAILKGSQGVNLRSAESSFILKQPPKWFKRPVGASWGFGGKLVTFKHKSNGESPVATIRTVATEHKFFEKAEALKNTMTDNSNASFADFCTRHVQDPTEPERDREIWKYLGVMLSPDASHVTEFLGLNKDKPPKIAELMSRLRVNEMLNDQPALEKALSQTASPQENGGFEGLDEASRAEEFALAPPKLTSTFRLYSKTSTEESDIDSLISKALIVGDFETATKICLASDRMADALMFAMNGPPELLSKTQREYFKRNAAKRSYSRMLQSVVYEDLADIVEHSDLEDSGVWKDIMGILYTYGSPEVLFPLLKTLGTRLEDMTTKMGADPKKRHEFKFASLLCFMGAGELEKVVASWVSESKPESVKGTDKFASYLASLQSFIDKVTVYRKAIHYADPELYAADIHDGYKLEDLYEKYVEYSKVVADQGLVDLAWAFLQHVPDMYVGSNPGLEKLPSLLKNKVAIHGGYVDANGSTPMFPYEVQDVIDITKAKAIVDNYGSNQYGAYQGYYGQQQQAPLHQQQSYAPPPVANAYQGNQSYYGADTTSSFYGGSSAYQASTTNYVQGNVYGQPPQMNTFQTAQTSDYSASYPSMTQKPALPPVAGPPPAGSVNWASRPETAQSSAKVFQRRPSSMATSTYPMGTQQADGFQTGPPPPLPTQPQHMAPPPVYTPQPSQLAPPPQVQPAPINQFAPPPQVYTPQPANQYTSAPLPPSPRQIEPPAPTNDRSKVSQGQKAVLDAFDRIVKQLNESHSSGPQQKKMLEDAEKKILLLGDQMNGGEIKGDVEEKLAALVKAIEKHEFPVAHKIQLDLMTTKFDVTGLWIVGLKRLIDVAERDHALSKTGAPIPSTAASQPATPALRSPVRSTTAPPPSMRPNMPPPPSGPIAPPPMQGGFGASAPPQGSFTQANLPPSGPMNLAPPPQQPPRTFAAPQQQQPLPQPPQMTGPPPSGPLQGQPRPTGFTPQMGRSGVFAPAPPTGMQVPTPQQMRKPSQGAPSSQIQQGPPPLGGPMGFSGQPPQQNMQGPPQGFSGQPPAGMRQAPPQGPYGQYGQGQY